MIFFTFSFLATLFGGLSASRKIDLFYSLSINFEGPFAQIIAFWPFIIALVLLLLVILWYQSIKNLHRRRKQGSTRPRQGSQSLVFMGLVTVFVIVLLAAPYYLESLDATADTEQTQPEDYTELLLTVHGMDCGGCEALVQRRVGALEGIESVLASHEREEVFVTYDKSRVSPEVIAKTIEDSGYTVAIH